MYMKPLLLAAYWVYHDKVYLYLKHSRVCHGSVLSLTQHPCGCSKTKFRYNLPTISVHLCYGHVQKQDITCISYWLEFSQLNLVSQLVIIKQIVLHPLSLCKSIKKSARDS